MINLIISILASIAVMLPFNIVLDAYYAGIIPALITFVGLYLYLSRKTMKAVEMIFLSAQKEIEKQNYDRGIDIIKSANKYSIWQFFVKGQVNAQVGTILYVNRKFKEAEPYLEKAFIRHWVARGMLAVSYFKRKDYAKMKDTFEVAVRSSKKESLLWNLYAYCMWKTNDRDGAIDILNRALKIIPDEERTMANRTALQNKGKMRMKPWKEMWFQFHLAKIPQQKARFDRRQVYRGRQKRR